MTSYFGSSFKSLVFGVGALFGTVAFIMIFSVDFSYVVGSILGSKAYSSFIAVATLLVSVMCFSFLYLQSGGTHLRREANNGGLAGPVHLNRIVEGFERARLEDSARLEALIERLEHVESVRGLSQEERDKVVEATIKQTGQEAIEDIFGRQANRFSDQLRASLSLDRLRYSSRGSIDRLMREISDLRLRSNINLLIGMAITAGGLWLLWSTVSMVDASALLKALASEGEESNGKFLKNLILPIVPRVLLVLFVEVFAYFFLRLYRNGLSEIKYFQNELTNLESKLTAVEFALVTENEDAMKLAIQSLSATERNFILEKGQTTVELERAKSESELTRNIIKVVPKLFEKK